MKRKMVKSMTAAVMAGIMAFAAVPVLAEESGTAAEVSAAAEISAIDLNEWNTEKWVSASEEEKEAASKAYVDTMNAALQTDMSSMSEDEINDIYKETKETLEIMFTQGNEVAKSLQELINEVVGDAAVFDGGEGSVQEDAADEAEDDTSDGSLTIENLETALDNMDLAEWNAEKWNGASDAEKLAAILVYFEAVSMLEGTDVETMDADEFASSFNATYEFIDEWFKTSDTEQTLQDYVSTEFEMVAEAGIEETDETEMDEAAGEDEENSMFFEELLTALDNMDLTEWNADKWAGASEAEKFAAVLVYYESIMILEGTDMETMGLEEFGTSFDATYEFIDEWFKTGDTDLTLQDYVNEEIEIVIDAETEEAAAQQ